MVISLWPPFLAHPVWPVVCVCLSQIGVLLKYLYGSSWFSTYPTGNSGIYKNKGTSLRNFVLNFRLKKFRHGKPSFERIINSARQRWTLAA